ncbi:MAG: hypothetical protein KJ072_06685 [Verrucomicrobia bacterium]|nr:hypothetical protein [Verrucomicrobiota bacterium]
MHLQIRLSWGHQSAAERQFAIAFVTNNTEISRIRPVDFEAGDRGEELLCDTRAGGGDVDGVTLDLAWSEPIQPRRKVQSIWQYLLEHGTAEQVARLKDDPGLQPGAPLLAVLTNPDGTRGFSIGLEQLARHGAMWLPEHDLFATLADAPVEFATHLASLKGERVLDRVKREPESTLADWTSRWEDFGNPKQWDKSWETSWLGVKGHLVGTVARHGSLYKFGVDRWANVRPDYASPHRFRFDILWDGSQWSAQRIVDGLPVIVTRLERDGQRCQIEQFAAPISVESALEQCPLTRPAGTLSPGGGEGEKSESVFFTKVQITGTGPVRFGFRLATENTNRHPELRSLGGRPCVVDRETGAVWLMIETDPGLTLTAREPIADDKDPRIELDCAGELVPGETRTLVIKLPSPVVLPQGASELAALDVVHAREETVRYWENWLAQGARFEVPEPAVNDLFRANLWHALMLPRHRTDEHGVARIDLPYSNFAYGQFNADWPINQAVYVDYMLYGLRGHFAVAEEEFAAMFHSQQKPDGRVGGYAEWGVYSPSMLYSIGQNFLLSRDRASFERLLSASLKALDWCLAEVKRGQMLENAPGLIVAPLNDLSQDARAWAFPNAYFVAGLELFGRALEAYGHPRGKSVQTVAEQLRGDVERAFARASVQSPVVQLADGTWNNYVPCDALTPRRLLDLWYPTDVDTGALHLSRLSAIDPRGWLSSALLHDHEDNLFLNQWGMANEPVYNQQATAYLLRDEPEAAIRAFYSMMACAFSHQQLSPLEHRWAWGQYYGPPSTDGAWFELYRNLLVNELADDGTLFIGQATPRAWLANGQRITIDRAPTHFGPVNLRIESAVAAGSVTAQIEFLSDRRPDQVWLRFRHPDKARLRSVSLNGEAWSDFDAERELIRIAGKNASPFRVVARY